MRKGGGVGKMAYVGYRSRTAAINSIFPPNFHVDFSEAKRGY